MRRVFYDFEFDDDGRTVKPISLGMTDGFRGVHLVNRDYMQDYQHGDERPNQWVVDNVIPLIYADKSAMWIPRDKMRDFVLDFVSDAGRITSRDDVELWGFYADYDHVVLAQLFGPMVDLPEPIPMWSHDVQQLVLSGDESLRLMGEAHNALHDAHNAYMLWYDYDQKRPKRFYLNRTKDVSGVSGTGRVAEGVKFASGKVIVHWNTESSSTVVWDSIEDCIAVHGHQGSTTVEWID